MKGSISNPSEFRKDLNEYLTKQYTENQGIPNADKFRHEPGEPTSGKRPEGVDFSLKPEELERFLNRYVVDQEDAIEVLATKISTHFNRMKLESNESEDEQIVGNIKSNILMIGPTGVGKTYIIKLIAKRIGVPFVKGDATKFSETGYVGGDVEDLVRDLVREADGDIKLAEYGIIYLDEIDKIAGVKNTLGMDVSRTGVQRNLLKLMEEAEVDLKVPHDLASQMEAAMEAQRTGKVNRKKINTKNILFVMSGAFGSLDEIIKKRLHKQSIGFQGDVKKVSQNPSDYHRFVRTEDLLEYGFESEFIGRLPVVTVLDDLDVQGLYKILKNPNSSVILGKKRDFKAYGIELEFEDDALHYIAEKAHEERTGARGLVGVVEKILIKFEKKLPSTGIRKFVVTRDVIENTPVILDKMLTSDACTRFRKMFQDKHGIDIEFTDEAIVELKRIADEGNSDFFSTCMVLFRDYEYGLKLAEQRSFVVTKEAVLEPKVFLDNLIKQSYIVHQSEKHVEGA